MRELAAILRFGLRAMRGHRALLALLAVLTIIELVTVVAAPALSGDVLDALARAHPVAEPLLVLALLALAATVVSLVNRVVSAVVDEALGVALRGVTLRGAWRRDALAIEKSSAGDLVTRVLGDATALKGALGIGLQLVVDAATVIAVVVLLASRSPSLALIAFVAAPLSLLLGRLLSPRIERASLLLRQAVSTATASVQSWATRGSAAKVLGLEYVALTQFETANANLASHGVRVGIWSGLIGAMAGVLTGATQVMLLAYGSLLVSRGRISVGELVAVTQYATFLLVPAQRIVQLLSVDVPALGPIHQRVRELSDVEDPPATPRPPEPRAIAVEGLRFERGELRLEVPELIVRRGEVVAICGVNGAGKTTLARLLAGAYPTVAGRWWLTDRNDKTIAVSTLRDVVDLVPQNPTLFDGTLADNATGFAADIEPARLATAAARAGFDAVVKRLPQGWDTPIDASCTEAFSGGELAKLAIVRACYRARPVLVLDEPSASLDAGATADLLRVLDALRQHHAVFVFTHDPSIQAFCARHYELVVQAEATVCKSITRSIVPASSAMSA